MLDLEEDNSNHIYTNCSCSSVVEEEKNGNNEIQEEGEAEAGENEEAIVTEEFTERDRLQQKRGTSNLLNEKDFIRHMEVQFNDFLLKI